MGKLELVGKTFGDWTVIARDKSVTYKTGWVCRCSCGTVKTVIGSELTGGRTTACAACRIAKTIKRNTTHGMTNSPEYNSWRGMVERCTNSNSISFPGYGGRGIKVCDEWLLFENFYRDMGERPEGMTIDRLDANGDYCNGNCEWKTPKQQNNNRRSNHLVEFNGAIMTIMQLSEILGINYFTLHGRLTKYKWSIEKVLAKESQKHG